MAVVTSWRSEGVQLTQRTWLRRAFDDLVVANRDATPSARDWLLASVFASAGALQYALATFSMPVARFAVASVAFALVPFRRRVPFLACALAVFAEFAFEWVALSHHQSLTAGVAHFLAGYVLLYALCRWESPKRVVVGVVSFVLMLAAPEVVDQRSLLLGLGSTSSWLAVASFALAMRYRANLIDQREVERRLEERNTLARELHDTVAHHVSAIAVQAQAAQFVATSRPDQAAIALKTIEEIANTAIDDMRRMVGVLRSESDRAMTTTPVSLEPLKSDTTPNVVLLAERDLSHLPSPLAHALFRIAQESITNARRHSRSVTSIVIRLHTDLNCAEIEVANDGLPTTRHVTRGFGLMGMSERVQALGGSLAFGPTTTSAWCVRASIPIRRPT
jgi:signal transduction histidine kinase